MAQQREYLSVTDTAKLIRQALKEAFPGVKFSVRSDSYSGGASIRIKWTDGPNAKQVDAIAQQFAGGYFDGMTDYKGAVYSRLDGKPVRFGADFVFTEREFTDAMLQRSIDAVARKYGETARGTVEKFRKGELWNVNPMPGWDIRQKCDLQSLIWQDLGKRSTMLPKESPTVARVAYEGDDRDRVAPRPPAPETEPAQQKPRLYVVLPGPGTVQ